MDVMDQLLIIRVNYKSPFILITIQNSFFVKLILIFSLVKTAFLSSYKTIILIFSLVRTAFFNFCLFYYIKCLRVNI